jgi:hypothetical protein
MKGTANINILGKRLLDVSYQSKETREVMTRGNHKSGYKSGMF